MPDEHKGGYRMYVTLSLRDIAVGLVLIALVILIIYIAIFFKNLIRTKRRAMKY